MIIWLTGNSGAGKTTKARELRKKLKGIVVILDGDEMRDSINRDLTLSNADRRKNNLRIARLAKVLEGQGFVVIVAVICPWEDTRKEVKEITGCEFHYLPYVGDDSRPGYPYQRPLNADVIYAERDIGLQTNNLVSVVS